MSQGEGDGVVRFSGLAAAMIARWLERQDDDGMGWAIATKWRAGEELAGEARLAAAMDQRRKSYRRSANSGK
ncbi:hypothetical protein SBA4_4830011 [Candidatus Sulfopaludibacter sp. SbA4]|nr:hypothetical protein SBA4_4830011 [Candidatus Sulfopaludibacter sp. SbA4]